MKFQRTGTDTNYEVRFQLGDSSLAPASSDTTGAAVNLRWGDKTKSGLTDEQNLSYVTGTGGTFTQIGVVSGSGGDAVVELTVNMDAKTYDISVTGAGLISGTGSATGVAFNNASQATIDRLVITLDQVNGADFSYKEIDAVEVQLQGYPWYGQVDEVRISNTYQSDAWIKATYANENSPSTFMTWGALEQPTLSITLKDAADATDYASWAIDAGKALDTASVMTTGNCVLVKNTGDVAMDVGLSAVGTNWTLGSSTGADQCVLMGRFNGDSAPDPNSFNAAYDVVTAALAWATSSGGTGLFEGASSGDNITVNNGRKLYMFLKTPMSVTAANKASETITVTLECKAH
jgi:hypothetical protein